MSSNGNSNSMSPNTQLHDDTAEHQSSTKTTTDPIHRQSRHLRRSNAQTTQRPAEFDVERWPDFVPLIKKHARNVCSTELLIRRLPIIGWTRQYQLDWLYRDILAGITVGLTAIPQGIAYAVVAGMQPQYGLYSELIPSFVYCVLGSSRHVTIGPTAIMALLVQRFAALSIEYAVLATFLTGCTVLALGVLNLGFLVRFISEPVTVGFTTAAALQIGSLQVKSLLGLPGKSSGFVEAWLHVFGNVQHTSGWDALLGIASIGFLVTLKLIGDMSGRWAIARQYIALARNALTVLIGSLIAYALTADGSKSPIRLTGPIVAGFPQVMPPPFETTIIVNGLNGTTAVHHDFVEMLDTFGASLGSFAFVAFLEIVVVAKAFSKGKPIDATQELIALGFCNIFGSFMHSMPVTGSFTRTAVNSASGVRTPYGGLVTGILVILSVGFLTETFKYIPKTSLAAVIITAMWYMMDFASALRIWRAKRIDIIPFLITLILCLWLGIDYGLMYGIGFNIVFIVFPASKPTIRIQRLSVRMFKTDNLICTATGRLERFQHLLMVRPDQSIIYSSAEHMRMRILRKAELAMSDSDNWCESTTLETSSASSADTEAAQQGRRPRRRQSIITGDNVDCKRFTDSDSIGQQPPFVVVIDGLLVRTIDVTVARNLRELYSELRILGLPLVLWRWPQKPQAIARRYCHEIGNRFWQEENSSNGDGDPKNNDAECGDDGPFWLAEDIVDDGDCAGLGHDSTEARLLRSLAELCANEEGFTDNNGSSVPITKQT